MTEKKNKPASDKNKSRTKKNANTFTFVLLALVLVLVVSVFIGINKHNKKLLSAETQNKQTENIGQKSADVTKADSQNNQPIPDATAPVTTTEPLTAIQVAKPGTMENPTIITIDEENWHLTLVNSSYRIPDDYEPNLVYVCGSGERLDSKIAEHYEKMYNAALEEGINLTPCSGYRSYELQERNYNNKVSFYESQGLSADEAKVKAATIIMPPGSSEHNLGYAMDIVCVDEWFEDTAEFKWLTENAADYGFIMRYPKDKQDITKVIYEPWHWRYVGVDLAKELKASGQVLEEYMGVV